MYRNHVCSNRRVFDNECWFVLVKLVSSHLPAVCGSLQESRLLSSILLANLIVAEDIHSRAGGIWANLHPCYSALKVKSSHGHRITMKYHNNERSYRIPCAALTKKLVAVEGGGSNYFPSES